MKRFSIKTQFYLGVGTILIICCLGASWYQYQNLQQQAMESVHQKTGIYLNAASSIRSYVKDVLRPRIQTSLNSEQFILEAMSTSYISRQIMHNLKESFPELTYRRAAIDPRNPVNSADDFEIGMISWFKENPQEEQWSGMVKKGGKNYYARMMPIIADKTCLNCHGNPADAPSELTGIYGTDRSYGYQVGDYVAADTIYIPMDKTNLVIKEKAIWVFLFGVASLFPLFAVFALLFNRTVIKKLKSLLLSLQQIYSEEKNEQELFGPPSNDELYQIKFAFENVTDNLKAVHDELKGSEAKYRTLFQASPDAIFVCDANGILTDINNAGAQLFEIDHLQAYLHQKSFPHLHANPEEGHKLFNTIQNKGFVTNTEAILATENGAQVTCSISARSLINERGEFDGIEGIIRDVSEEKALNKHLAQTERLASIGQLAAGVAHEINNPLGVILCYGDLIQKIEPTNPQIKEDSEIIKKHALSCKTIVESLLNFARVSETKMKQADIHACLEEILQVLRNQMKKQNIIVNQELDQNIEHVLFDEDKIKQVFMNLLINSMQAMPEGGELQLMTFMDQEREEIKIDVSDTGYGIPEDKLDKIFEPFYTTKERGQGTGLGLSVSYGIIQQHHGNISVSSQPGQGTTFSIQLPVNGNTQIEHQEATL